jgi:zinc transport system ATP-binding protein
LTAAPNACTRGAVSGTPILETEKLTVERDGQRVVEGVDLRVMPGTIHLVIGPNGAGKSTLVAALLGQAAFTGAARCHFRGSGRVGFVPQSFPVDRTLPVTVLEMLALSRQRLPVCLGVRRSTRTAVARLLDRVGLAGFEARLLGALSGGELRRVLLAEALDPAPELLLLDEPASGLDQASVARLESAVRELRDTHGTGVLMVSHDVAQVRRLADEVTWLDRTVRRRGTAAEVLGDGSAFPFGEIG